MREEKVEHMVEGVDRSEVDLDDETVLTGEAMALGDVWHLLRELGDTLQLPRQRTDANDGHDRQPDRLRINVDTITANDAGVLEPLHAFAHGRAGHADPSGKF